MHVFFPADLDERLEKARAAAEGDAARLHALDLQKAYIEAVKKPGIHHDLFSDADELIKKCLTLDLPTIAHNKPSNLPYGTLGTLFKGRETKLEEVHQHITARAARPRGSSVKLAIHGLGGVGKTRFVIEYALRHDEDYSAILFVTADTPESLRRNLAALCKPLVLNLPEQDAKEEEVQLNAVLKWLQVHEGWLLILDNVDTVDMAAEIEQLVGPMKGGTVLITSRLSDWSGEVTSFELDELAEPAAAEFFLARTKDRRQHLATDEADALTLARELGGLALALEQAGAFIAQKRSSIQAYLQRWRERNQEVRKWNDPRLTKYPRALVSTWETTVQQLSPEARSLLQQVSWLAPESIPRIVFPEGSAQDALAELAGFSLVKFEAEGMRFRVHRLVQEVTLEQQIDEERNLSLHKILAVLDQATVDDPRDVWSWPVLDRLRPHLAVVTAHADRHGILEPTSRLMNDLGVLLLAKASHKEAEPFMRRALAIDEASSGPDHPRVAVQLNNLALLLQATDRLEEAERLMRRALAIDEASSGPDHPDVGRDLNNLAHLLQATNRLEEAEPLMRRALAIDEASSGPDHPKVATRLNNLAHLLQATNRLAEAEPLMRRHVVIFLKFTRSTGNLHPHLSVAIRNYASLLEMMALGQDKFIRTLIELGAEAGFDPAGFIRLLQQVLR